MLHLNQATDTMYVNIPVATPEAIKPPYNMLYGKIQSHCNNKATSTYGLILTLIKRETIMYKVMSSLTHKTH